MGCANMRVAHSWPLCDLRWLSFKSSTEVKRVAYFAATSRQARQARCRGVPKELCQWSIGPFGYTCTVQTLLISESLHLPFGNCLFATSHAATSCTDAA